MPRSISRLSAAVLLAGAFLALSGRASAAGVPLAGNWILKDVSSVNEASLVLLQIEEKDGKANVKVLAAPLLGGSATLKNVRVDADSIRFDLDLSGNLIPVSASAAKGDAKPKTLRGTLVIRGGAVTLLAEFDRTELKELSGADARKPGPAAAALRAAQGAEDKPAALKEVVEKFSGSGAAYLAANSLLRSAVQESAKDADLRAAVERFVKAAAPFGTSVEKTARLSVVQLLARADKVSPLAVEYAHAAEKALSKDSSLSDSAAVLKALETVLRKSGKTDEAKSISSRIAKIDAALDEEFEKTAVPFKPTPFPGRKGKSSRLAVVELFTGAQCPPCVSADVAFDAAVKSYKSADVILLQYHLHIPGPDPLTNADSEKRAEFYGDAIEGTPTMFVNGKATEGLGGLKQHGQERFKTLSEIINAALEAEDQGSMKLSVDRKGDNLDIKANVSGLKKTGEKVRLRFVLIEEVARYQGGNGQRLHHHVVRAFPGGIEGFALKDAKDEQTVKVALGNLRNNLKDYLEAAGKKRPFRDDERPLELKQLKVVALIQDDATKEILQGAQVDVPAQ